MYGKYSGLLFESGKALWQVCVAAALMLPLHKLAVYLLWLQSALLFSVNSCKLGLAVALTAAQATCYCFDVNAATKATTS
ncbi:hypothetical protein [Microseira sp. BLCC-F43]|jgi:hypothetical protein|uniref:hypothetical protein n=1 Tax=Microseira sp. BLCC-F43 TaxID=3153602 RepID=UPI0035B6E690